MKDAIYLSDKKRFGLFKNGTLISACNQSITAVQEANAIAAPGDQLQVCEMIYSINSSVTDFRGNEKK